MADLEKASPGQYLTFSLNTQGYGVPIAAVREINRMSEITPMPQAPTYVVGVMNLRGKIIPVIDLKCKLGMAPTAQTKDTCVIVIDVESRQVGMIVDSVSAVTDLAADQIEPAPQMSADPASSYVLGMGKLDNQVVILLAIVRCLSSESIVSVSATLAAEPASANSAA